MNKIKIAVHGARGRMGSSIVSKIKAQQDKFDYVGSLERDSIVPDCDIVIDVSSAKGTKNLLGKLTGQKLVVGSTGDLPMDNLRTYSKDSAVVVVPNFSPGITILKKVLPILLQDIPDAWSLSLTDLHHRHKKDSPSGTAKSILETIKKTYKKSVDVQSVRQGEHIGEHTITLGDENEKLEIKHTVTNRDVFATGALHTAKWLMKQENGLYDL